MIAPPSKPAATPAATPRCALAGVAASEPAIVGTATKAANVFFILGPPVLAWRAATRPPHDPRHQEIPPLHVNPPAGHRTGRFESKKRTAAKAGRSSLTCSSGLLRG